MKTQVTLIALLFCLAPSSFADTFDIAGRQVTVPVPPGFVRVTPEMDAVHRLSQQMADPMNDLLAYYIAEADVPVAKKGEIPALDKTFMLKVNKQLKAMNMDRRDFVEFTTAMKKQNEEIMAQVKSQMPEVFDKISQGISKEFNTPIDLKATQMIPLDPHFESDHALASSMYVNYGMTAEGAREQFVVAATSTFLNASGKLLFCYCYAPKEELEWTRSASKDWSESIYQANAPPSARAGGGALNWDSVHGLIGGLLGAGAVIALIYVLNHRKKKA